MPKYQINGVKTISPTKLKEVLKVEADPVKLKKGEIPQRILQNIDKLINVQIKSQFPNEVLLYLLREAAVHKPNKDQQNDDKAT